MILNKETFEEEDTKEDEDSGKIKSQNVLLPHLAIFTMVKLEFYEAAVNLVSEKNFDKIKSIGAMLSSFEDNDTKEDKDSGKIKAQNQPIFTTLSNFYNSEIGILQSCSKFTVGGKNYQ